MIAAIAGNTRAGMTATCLAYAGQNYNPTVYLELAAHSPQTLRAFWARIVERERRWMSVVEILDETGESLHDVRPQGDHKLMKIERADKGFCRLILADERFHHTKRLLFFGGRSVKAHFADALRRNTDIPFLDKWAPALFRQGYEERLVQRIDSKGVNVFKLIADKDKWRNVLTTLFKKGELAA